MRRAFSFCCAIALFCASAYAIYAMFTAGGSVKALWLIGAGALLFVSVWWLWEDFMKGAPHGGREIDT